MRVGVPGEISVETGDWYPDITLLPGPSAIAIRTRCPMKPGIQRTYPVLRSTLIPSGPDSRSNVRAPSFGLLALISYAYSVPMLPLTDSGALVIAGFWVPL